MRSLAQPRGSSPLAALGIGSTHNKRSTKRFAPIAALVAAFAMIFSALGMIAAPAQAADEHDDKPGGNYGTIKVHKMGTPSGTEDNNPKVCAFDIEGFKFAAGFAGYLKFAVQGGDAPVGYAPPEGFRVGPANASGYFVSGLFNVDVPGATFLADGHYKVTVYGKFNDTTGTYKDRKSKSKVFKVDCPPATPPAATRVDLCEPATGTNDRYTIPFSIFFTYQVNGTTVAAGTYAAPLGTPNKYVVTATPKPGVEVTAGALTRWEFEFTKVACTAGGTTVDDDDDTEVLGASAKAVRGAVRMMDKCDRSGDRFWVKRVRGVTYKVNGRTIREGVWLRAGTMTVKVRAVPTNNRFRVVGRDMWTLRFTNKPCAVAPAQLPATGA